MKLEALTMGWIIWGCQLVLAQRFPPSQYFRPIRACRAHQPLRTNVSSDVLACTRETFRVSNVKDPDADKNILQISQENGYVIDSYNLTTSDGYILTLFRISGGRKSPAKRGKPSVLLLHGWGNSCEAWIALPNDKNIVYMLADAGWDVWLGNFRGSSFSLQHTRLNADRDPSYWDFTFHEMGLFDFPMMLDQARRVSENDKVFVIGHSQGATAILVAASEVPGINEKIHAAYFMAPAVYLVKSFLHLVQNARSCSFRYYDRGAKENLRRYGSREPPSYNLNRVWVPVYIFYAEQDGNVTPSDVQRLREALPSETVRDVVRVNDDTFNHLDFLVAKDANVLVYKPLIHRMTEFNK
ncbi:unnamed protein product [Orchesella dallaii]|uniref:Partial AB-hydrolase lipase domain-containing protein n=1 Tax=Orchesella dallaii TaxID=48710 RepID=A0ABP1RV99_9HEXA